MAIHTGKVIDGKIIVNVSPLPEGTAVTILVPDDEAPFALTPELEAEFDAAIAQADRGETKPAEEFLSALRARTLNR